MCLFGVRPMKKAVSLHIKKNLFSQYEIFLFQIRESCFMYENLKVGSMSTSSCIFNSCFLLSFSGHSFSALKYWFHAYVSLYLKWACNVDAYLMSVLALNRDHYYSTCTCFFQWCWCPSVWPGWWRVTWLDPRACYTRH